MLPGVAFVLSGAGCSKCSKDADLLKQDCRIFLMPSPGVILGAVACATAVSGTQNAVSFISCDGFGRNCFILGVAI